ncbi:MAG: hypothetical protein IKY02_06295 [Lachnospiraceae bacterium]|nr:hypothetical protein [Lachnospiraceae bacterium]
MSEGCKKLLTILVLAATVLIAILPMRLAPLWNGEQPGHRNQYEKLAEAFLEGHLDIDYGDMDPKLLALENPYDPAERQKAGVFYHWDHSFFNGKYYMYFGVVPVVLVFLPFRAVFGTSLTTYHGTQFCAAVFIIGVFALFFLLRKRFFKDLSYGATVLLSAAVSFMSVWYASAAPAMYCTAIASGLAMEIWSIYFFVKAVYGTESENRAVFFAFFGALFGALAFGCRPPVALANVLVIPMLIDFIRARKFSLKLLGKLVLAALPYFVIGGALMWYNYARFGSVTEFGQSYQLTMVDASQGFQLTAQGLVGGLTYYLWKTDGGDLLLNYGAVFTFPILLLSILPFFRKQARGMLKKVLPLYAVLLALPVLIAAVDTAGSPALLPRYRMDVYWILGLAAFAGIGVFGQTIGNKKFYSGIVGILAVAAIVMSIILFYVPYDANFASTLVK